MLNPRRSATLVRIACTLLTSWVVCATAAAAQLQFSVLDPSGHGIGGIVLVVEGRDAGPTHKVSRTELMDQRHMQFVPNILVVQTGTGVEFPNSDQVQHQVYSFSPAKTFQLSLYAGHKYPPIIFDKPGLVTLGCNIHDSMIGYVYVTDSSFFGRTGADGQLLLKGLPAGDYTVTAWHPLLQEASGTAITLHLNVGADDNASQVIRLMHPLHMDMAHMGDKKWADY